MGSLTDWRSKDGGLGPGGRLVPAGIRLIRQVNTAPVQPGRSLWDASDAEAAITVPGFV